jgi:1-acyl-sn-glycerol-3-phosphate acyltransferase
VVASEKPLILYLNHPSWWDPLTLLLVTQHLWPDRRFAAPMDAAALARYRVLERIGLFPVEQGTRRGARQFLQSSESALRQTGGALCVTAQGRFADVRERPVRLQPGLGHLARRTSSAVFIPLALEYPFWEERLPEILVHFGSPIEVEDHADASAAEWTRIFEQSLEQTLGQLSVESMSRDAGRFEVILGGSAGVGGVYDLWRRLRALVSGQQFNPEHSRP